ncbi:methyl-accepting chemotaxis protein [Terrilactibacillus sp. S3-3]|nr:methyl-accepting chemotaxis protein [Terrilactibacillus sp. S3-3]
MINRLKNIVAGIQSHTEGTAKRIDELNESSDEISHQVKQVTMSIEDIASGAESEANTSMNALERVQEGLELSQSISESAGRSKKMSDVTVKNLAESSGTVQALIQGIHLISESNEKMSQEATELKEHAASIDTIVDTVADIAEKTHMLALNANIEAARAGESGKALQWLPARYRSWLPKALSRLMLFGMMSVKCRTAWIKH